MESSGDRFPFAVPRMPRHPRPRGHGDSWRRCSARRRHPRRPCAISSESSASPVPPTCCTRRGARPIAASWSPRNPVLGKTVRELNLEHRFNVTVTRITRADLEVTAVPGLAIQFGDMLQLVGPEHLDQAAAHLGNSLEALNQTNFVPIFLGIAAGILVGFAQSRSPACRCPFTSDSPVAPCSWP